MYRSLLRIAFLFVPILAGFGVLLVVLGVGAIYLSPGFTVATLTRLFYAGGGIALVLLARKIFRAGEEYLDMLDYGIVAWSSFAMGFMLIMWQLWRLPEISGTYGQILLVLPSWLWAVYLFSNLEGRPEPKRPRESP